MTDAWRFDLDRLPTKQTVLVKTVKGLVRRARTKGYRPRIKKGRHQGVMVIDCWGTDPHADLVALCWRPMDQ
jgi:hypothetical protein